MSREKCHCNQTVLVFDWNCRAISRLACFWDRLSCAIAVLLTAPTEEEEVNLPQTKHRSHPVQHIILLLWCVVILKSLGKKYILAYFWVYSILLKTMTFLWSITIMSLDTGILQRPEAHDFTFFHYGTNALFRGLVVWQTGCLIFDWV